MVPGYREIRELGAGGGGRVVLATYAATGAYVAIKYLNAALKDDRGFLARFRDEAHVMVELRDPNVVQFYEYYEDVLEAAIVMELVDGVALRKILAEHGSTSPEAALTVLKGSLLGLAFAHSAGVVHRDYKPENVLIQADGTSKLTDFGIATHVGESDAPAGTPPYMAPEQWTGAPASTATDVYAATCVFFECLTGRRPYTADHHAALMYQHQNAPVPVEHVPSSVRGLVAWGMAKAPMDRPSTARAFLSELELAALSAYGPEWEQRGRRHLAELATLLALAFPLAKPAPKASTSVAQSVIGRMGRMRRPRLGPRMLAGAGVITVAVTVGLVAANQSPDRLSADTIFTPSSPSVTGDTPAGQSQDVESPPEPIISPRPGSTSRAQLPANPADADHPTPTPSKSQVRAPVPIPVPSKSQTQSPVPSKSATNAPTPTSAPTPTGSGSPPVHTVSGLSIMGIDANGTTVDLRASTSASVVLTVGFAEGQNPDRLKETPPRTFTLAGLKTYSHTVPHTFTAPACGQTLYRRVTVFTSPQAAEGVRSRTMKVSGEPCPAPSVESVDIATWNGAAATVRIRADGPGEVRLTATFTRRESRGDEGGEGSAKVLGTRARTLSGKTGYSVSLSIPASKVACGERALFGITVVTDRPAANGTQVKEVSVEGPECAPPTVSITSFNGTTVSFQVRTPDTSAVTVRLGFAQKAGGRLTDSTRVLRLSGDTGYTRRVTGEFAALPECGEPVQRLVTIDTVPAGETQSRDVKLDLPPCEPDPSVSPSPETGDGAQVPDEPALDEPAPDGTL
jgi:serine/threonine-protein kinase